MQIEKYLKLDIIRQIPEQINKMTEDLVDDLTRTGGSLQNVKENLRKALDELIEEIEDLKSKVSIL